MEPPPSFPPRRPGSLMGAETEKEWEDEVQNHCTTLVFRFHLAPPHEDKGARGERNAAFRVHMDPPAQAGHWTFPHPPPTHRCSRPAQGLITLRLDLLRQRETGQHQHRSQPDEILSGMYKKRSWMRDVGNSEWDTIQHE